MSLCAVLADSLAQAAPGRVYGTLRRSDVQYCKFITGTAHSCSQSATAKPMVHPETSRAICVPVHRSC